MSFRRRKIIIYSIGRLQPASILGSVLVILIVIANWPVWKTKIIIFSIVRLQPDFLLMFDWGDWTPSGVPLGCDPSGGQKLLLYIGRLQAAFDRRSRSLRSAPLGGLRPPSPKAFGLRPRSRAQALLRLRLRTFFYPI